MINRRISRSGTCASYASEVRARSSMATMPDGPSLQERYAPESICFGCGPANADGLHVRSWREADEAVADWMPAPQHQAFPGILNGGIIGTLMDCHSNWTAAEHLMR